MTDPPQQSHDSGVTASLNALLEDIARYIRVVSEEEKRRLLIFLEDAWKSHRRRHDRKPYSVVIYYATENRLFRDFIKNIGAGGVLIESAQPLPVGTHMTLSFADPNLEEPFKIPGQIVWKGINEIGVEFIAPPSEELLKIIESL